jgi:hypothetical protein
LLAYFLQGIPFLAILNEQGQVMTEKVPGVMALSVDPNGESFPWDQEKMATLEGKVQKMACAACICCPCICVVGIVATVLKCLFCVPCLCPDKF